MYIAATGRWMVRACANDSHHGSRPTQSPSRSKSGCTPHQQFGSSESQHNTQADVYAIPNNSGINALYILYISICTNIVLVIYVHIYVYTYMNTNIYIYIYIKY